MIVDKAEAQSIKYQLSHTVLKCQSNTDNNRRLEKSIWAYLILSSKIIYEYLLFFVADICKNYQNLTERERKYDYITVNPKCDDTLNGWYRFQGAAGTRMVTTCPPEERCDARFPAWLSGEHPSVAEDKVQRQVCIHRFGDCCETSHFIQVKNCRSYFIYNLGYLGVCDTRYCGTD